MGDGDAAVTAGYGYLYAIGVRRDVSSARRMFRRAGLTAAPVLERGPCWLASRRGGTLDCELTRAYSQRLSGLRIGCPGGTTISPGSAVQRLSSQIVCEKGGR
jgi:hypothetical protein